MRTRFASVPAAVAARYAVRRMVRRLTNSTEVADNMMIAAVVAVVMFAECLPMFLAAVALLAAAIKHSKKLRKEDEE